MYRITPLDSKTPSPHELLFGRKPRTFMPSTNLALSPHHPETDLHRQSNLDRQQKQATHYNRHAHYDAKPLQPGDPVNVYNSLNKQWEPASIVSRERERSYIVKRGNRELHRTREHLKPRRVVPQQQPELSSPPTPQTVAVTPRSTEPAVPATSPAATNSSVPSETRTRSGRIVKPPVKYNS